MKRRLVFLAVIAAVLGTGVVESASAYTICVRSGNQNIPIQCVSYTPPK